MKTINCFAVDLGASGGKCFAARVSRRSLRMEEIHRFAYEPVTFYLRARNGRRSERMHWDDTFIYANIVEGLRAYRRAFSSRLDSVGIDTWGADGIFMTPSGDMLGKMYAYRDHRLDDMTAKVKRRISAGRIYTLTGIHFQPFNVSNQVFWFIRHRGSHIERGCKFVPVPSLFYHFLGSRIAVDSTWASVTQLMDARRRRWSAEILDCLGVPRRVMPPIVAPGTLIGILHAGLADSIGLNRAKLVAVGSHDTACAFAAAPVEDEKGALIVSSGTWSLVGRLVPEPVTTHEAMASNLSNEGGIGNIRLLKNCMGGWLAHELRRIWREKDGREMDWAEMYRLARNSKPFAALIDPDDPSFYNPPDMERAIARFCVRTGQKPPRSRGAMLRAVYESLALKYQSIAADIDAVTGCQTRVVHIVGGGSRNELLNQFTADALGVPVVAGPVEATAVGNVLVQAMGLKIVRSLRGALPVVRKAFPIRTFHPSRTDDWRNAHARFGQLVPRSR